MRSREKELRCFCRSTPLLATYGVDRDGRLFVHIKIWKQSRIYGEFVFMEGVAKIRCRNCLRWHRIVFMPKTVQLSEDESPYIEASSG